MPLESPGRRVSLSTTITQQQQQRTIPSSPKISSTSSSITGGRLVMGDKGQMPIPLNSSKLSGTGASAKHTKEMFSGTVQKAPTPVI